MAVFYRIGREDECEAALGILYAYEKAEKKRAEEK